ncbi:fused MFS/spermidine synthase [Deltaproteobacteria bacterium OttesenSCG-928-K17]|nr:fused MFS/spermidine synthase [Deltaproteobacteria bacterium OttesenSCG-928-K17]
MSSGLLSKFMEAFQGEDHLTDDIVFEGDSLYHHIVIREEGELRTMYFGPLGDEAETSVNMANPDRAVFEYPGMMLAALPLHPEGRRVAMIGLGGGYLPGLFQRHLPQYELTVVEVDLLVAELAQIYFGFAPGGNVRLVIGDGRDFIERQPEGGLDQIWLDAFSGDYVPPQLSGREFLEICASRLAPGGLLVQNLHQSRPRAFQNQLKTTAAVFRDYGGLDGRRCGNAIIISRVPGGAAGPAWKKSALESAAKTFGRRLGPYDLVDEMRKFKKFIPDADAEVVA